MSNTTRLILIWGGLIFAYLAFTNAQGSTSFVNSLGNFAKGITFTLQGRGSGAPAGY